MVRGCKIAKGKIVEGRLLVPQLGHVQARSHATLGMLIVIG